MGKDNRIHHNPCFFNFTEDRGEFGFVRVGVAQSTEENNTFGDTDPLEDNGQNGSVLSGTRDPVPGKNWIEPNNGMEFVWIPGAAAGWGKALKKPGI